MTVELRTQTRGKIRGSVGFTPCVTEKESNGVYGEYFRSLKCLQDTIFTLNVISFYGYRLLMNFNS